jgi:outer membrane protein OmpA-like peptidoglycan-associated protein
VVLLEHLRGSDLQRLRLARPLDPRVPGHDDDLSDHERDERLDDVDGEDALVRCSRQQEMATMDRRMTRALDGARGPALVLLAVLGLAAGEARAEPPYRGFYIGGFGGGTIVLRDWDLGSNAGQNGLEPTHSGMMGLRLGFLLIPHLAVEAEVAWLPMRSNAGGDDAVFAYVLDVAYHVLRRDWTPVVEAGVGLYHVASGDLGTEADPRFHLGVGLRGMLAPWMAFRVDLRDVLSDGFDRGGSNNLELTAGLDFFVWRGQPPVSDRDHDGLADAEDACPDQAGPRELSGCPDGDGDGVADREDRCPGVAGKPSLGGCPDSDGDGVGDADDLCSTVPGKPEFRGCPDTDNDGVPDAGDRCPKEAGKPTLKGCPDSDGDGIADIDDRCPKEAGKAELKGCPDRDRDGVPDIDDRCPDQPGVKENQGCIPEAVAKKFTGTIRGIEFAEGSARIMKTSRGLLDEAVAALKEVLVLRLRIEGHTDNRGKAARNQRLSQARAEAVRKYLVGKGVAEDRLEAVGYGDTKPAKDNRTARGRAANRRIEFTPLGPK